MKIVLTILVILISCNIGSSIPARATETSITYGNIKGPKTFRTCKVRTAPKSLGVSDFYSKYCDAGGIPILASAEVSNKSLIAASKIIKDMARDISEPIWQSLISSQVHIAIIGQHQGTSDIPEYESSVRRMGVEALDKRTRGLGGRVASAGEENLLCLKNDRYRGESILIHEFAHTLWEYGIKRTDKDGTLRKRLNQAFKNATTRKHLLNKYAGTNSSEYWAEGVQTFFNANLPSDIKKVNSENRSGLIQQDPALYKLIKTTFGLGRVAQCHNRF